MPELSPELVAELVAAAAVGSVATLIGSAILLPWVVSRMPADYFVAERGGAFAQAHPALRFGYHAVKNLVGAILFLAGVAMLVLPGQGLLTILAALSLLDFPGKRRLELRIVRLKQIGAAIAWLRRRAGQPPLELPERDQLQEEGGA